jgi:plastocyanin
MRSSSLAALAAVVAGVQATHHDVTVGKDAQLKFVPEAINAVVGDTVTYHFFSRVILFTL